MPFLIPALTSGLCDAAIVYFGWYISLPPSVTLSEDPSIQMELHKRVYQTGYLVPLALFRFILIVFPLPYRSYTGTAVRCPLLYQFYYGVSLFVFLVHMLALIMIDPKSLCSLFSSAGWHDSMTRHAWLMITFSLISTGCHIVLYMHVRSTAPHAVDFWRNQRPKVLFYYAKEREDTERDALLRSNSFTFRQIQNGNQLNGSPNGESGRLSRQSSLDSVSIITPMHEFVVDLQARIQKAKLEWTKRMEDYRVSLAGSLVYSSSMSEDHQNGGNMPGSGSHHGAGHDVLHRSTTPFRVLLQLFAYEDVLTNGRLNTVYDHDDGEELLFFVPQLLTFLLHGAYDSSPLLEEWILETCRKNIYFAHRCYWFLRAWCLESGSINGTNDFDSQASQNVHLRRRLSRSDSLGSLGSDNADDMLAIATTPLTSTHGDSRNNLSKYSPEERAVLAELLLRVMQNGEESARTMYFGTGRVDPEDDGSIAPIESPSGKKVAVETGMIPINPLTNLASESHWESLVAPRRIGFLPLGSVPTLQSPTTQRRRSIANGGLTTSYFDQTPLFMDALLALADNLFNVPKEQRTDELKQRLRVLECQSLPSNSIYLPFRNMSDRVWRIVVDESIAIGTKERVPCIITLEVVNHWYEDDNRSTTMQSSNHVRNFFDRAARPETYVGRSSALSERQMIDQWRFGYRDPHRRDTPFEKFAHTMRKIPLKQMKTSMKAQIEKLRDTRTNIQDLLTVNVPGSFDENDDEVMSLDDSTELRTGNCVPKTDIERGESLGSAEMTKSVRSVSPVADREYVSPATPKPPTGSPIAHTKMGQWSPHHSTRNATIITLEDSGMEVPSLAPPGRISNTDSGFQTPGRGAAESTGANGKHSPVSYGSNGLIAWRKRQKMILEGNIDSPPTQDIEGRPRVNRNGKAPPVVFKENWKEKEERLRPHSAYGAHPGWRLMPILVKSNDDLRQEQLASQLIYRMSSILARERVPVWLCPYEILAITDRGGVLEAIPDTISIASLKKNDPNFTDLKTFFRSYFDNPDDLADAKANFCESLAAYSMVSFLLQIKDRHNGNILLDNRGHLIHIDFGFFFLSSPGKNTGFESAPFKLTRDFVGVLDGPESRTFRTFRLLCYRAFIALRRHCMEIILLVEMLKKGNEDLACFRGRPDDAIQELRDRFRLDLNDRACMEYVNALVDESIENWRTNWYDRYQRYCVGVL